MFFRIFPMLIYYNIIILSLKKHLFISHASWNIQKNNLLEFHKVQHTYLKPLSFISFMVMGLMQLLLLWKVWQKAYDPYMKIHHGHV
jgi:hypothetical protein